MIAYSAFRTLLFRILSVTATLLSSILIARLFGASARGMYAMATMVAGVAAVCLTNPSLAITHQVSKGEEAAEVLRQGLIVGAIYSSLAVVGTLGYFLWNPQPWIWAVGFALPLMVTAALVSGAMLGIERILVVNVLHALPAVTAVAVLPVIAGVGEQGVLVAWVAGHGAAAVWAVVKARSTLGVSFSLQVDWVRARSLIRFGLGIAAANLLSYLNYRIDAFLVESYRGIAELGVYSMAISAAELLWFISTSISTAIYGRVGKLAKNEAAALTATAVRYTIALVASASVVLYLAAPVLIPLLFGKDFSGAIAPFRILLPGVAAYSLASLLSAYFTNQSGKPMISTWLAATSMLINLSISMVLIPRHGMVGGAIATSVSYSVVVVVALNLFCRTTGLSWASLLRLTRADVKLLTRAMERLKALLSRRHAQTKHGSVE